MLLLTANGAWPLPTVLISCVPVRVDSELRAPVSLIELRRLLPLADSELKVVGPVTSRLPEMEALRST